MSNEKGTILKSSLICHTSAPGEVLAGLIASWKFMQISTAASVDNGKKKSIISCELAVCSGGPVDIYYIPSDGAHQGSKYAFQIFSCWKPLLCSTAKCFTKVICQSDVPVFVPETADVFVDGKDVSIYAPISAAVHLPENDDERIQTRPRSILVPEKGIAVIYAADMKKFNEWTQVVVTDGMTVFCQGRSEISFASEASGTVYSVMKNCV